MCTSTDLLNEVTSELEPTEKIELKNESRSEEVSTDGSTPGERDDKRDGYGMKLAAAAVGGLAVASAATFMLMKPSA